MAVKETHNVICDHVPQLLNQVGDIVTRINTRLQGMEIAPLHKLPSSLKIIVMWNYRTGGLGIRVADRSEPVSVRLVPDVVAISLTRKELDGRDPAVVVKEKLRRALEGICRVETF